MEANVYYTNIEFFSFVERQLYYYQGPRHDQTSVEDGVGNSL